MGETPLGDTLPTTELGSLRAKGPTLCTVTPPRVTYTLNVTVLVILWSLENTL
jgi:hypothetical protein